MSKTWQELFEHWSNDAHLEADLKAELSAMDDNQKEDAFYTNLEFGTAGMRGVMGAGTNRMNIYTIRKANDGFARYIAAHGEDAKKRGIVIAYDCRHHSKEFALESAKVMASYGVKAYVFEELRPTPELSFAVRHLNAFAGIVITASHNPKQYNGYKIYDETGCQCIPEEAAKVVALVNEVEDELTLKVDELAVYQEQGLIEIIGESIDSPYNDAVVNIKINDVPKDDVVVVFSPQHGTAHKPVMRALETLGYAHIHEVAEQAEPNGDFPTVKLPNPEDKEAFTLAIELGKKVNADVLLATDPDADRLGLAVRNSEGEYELLNGNVTGALTFYYIVSQRQANGTLPVNPVMFTTVVSSDFAKVIADKYGVSTEHTLTGFKFIGDRIAHYEQTGAKNFVFGFEESYGSLIDATIARDKDAPQAVVMAVEMAAFYKAQGKSLLDVLEELYQEFGYFREDLINISLAGITGAQKIKKIMEYVAVNHFTNIAGMKVVQVDDFIQSISFANNQQTPITLPKAEVLKFYLEDGSWFCLRPSGTEPKAKVYISVRSATEAEAQKLIDAIRKDVMAVVQPIIDQD